MAGHPASWSWLVRALHPPPCALMAQYVLHGLPVSQHWYTPSRGLSVQEVDRGQPRLFAALCHSAAAAW